MGENDRRDKLVKLGPERLADALLELAGRTDAAEVLVERLTSSKEEITKRFKAQLSGLKRSKRFVDWRGASVLAEKLDDMLTDLATAEPDAITGIRLLCDFYDCDSSIFERCDDSNGSVSTVFKYHAGPLFVEYAERCDDKEHLCDLLFELYAHDDYGVRAVLLDEAHHYLDEEMMRKLADRMWERCEGEEDEFKRRHWTVGIESIARQLKDPALFEKARMKAWPVLQNASFLDIASVYLGAGELETALSWMQRITELEISRADKRDQLLLVIYKELGDGEKMSETAWRMFRRERSEASLVSLLLVIGDEEREAVISKETETIMASERLSYSDASFLVQVGRMEEAESYLLRYRQSLDGDLYFILRPLAEALENESPVGATVLYRALLDSILSRAESKYYNHGVRYLKKLDRLEGRIGDWKGLRPHQEYKAEILETHGRKRSFWSKYPGS